MNGGRNGSTKFRKKMYNLWLLLNPCLFSGIGSAQYLKSRFGRGYQLDVLVNSSDQESINRCMNFIENSFPSPSRIESHGASLKYRLDPESSLSLSQLFAKLEANKSDACIQEYGIIFWGCVLFVFCFAAPWRQHAMQSRFAPLVATSRVSHA